ncbi:hypothetical protein D3C85_1533890 [compost metagenome]
MFNQTFCLLTDGIIIQETFSVIRLFIIRLKHHVLFHREIKDKSMLMTVFRNMGHTAFNYFSRRHIGDFLIQNFNGSAIDLAESC